MRNCLCIVCNIRDTMGGIPIPTTKLIWTKNEEHCKIEPSVDCRLDRPVKAEAFWNFFNFWFTHNNHVSHVSMCSIKDEGEKSPAIFPKYRGAVFSSRLEKVLEWRKWVRMWWNSSSSGLRFGAGAHFSSFI